MCPTILHIYGPFAINSYGFFIALGIGIALWCASKDTRASKLITSEQAISLLSGSIIAGIIGARFLYFMFEQPNASWFDIFLFWQGGGTELGSVIFIALFAGFYLWFYNLKPLSLLDLAGTYAPLVQAFSRIGCFCAGCCHGFITQSPCHVVYTNPASLAPLNVPLFPAQLFASGLFFALFALMYLYGRRFTVSGQQFFLYLMGASTVRFILDFFRGDLVYPETSYTFIDAVTTYQWVSIGLFIASALGFFITTRFYSSSRRS